MHMLQIFGVIVLSVMFLATPSLAGHHKKAGKNAKAGQKSTAKSHTSPRASQNTAKHKPALQLGGQEGEPVKPTGSIGTDRPMGMP